MTKPAACVFGLLFVLSAASCFDLRDVDPCQSMAVAACDRSCGVLSREVCVSSYRDTCLSGKWSAEDIDACTEALKGADLCLNSTPAACEILQGGGLIGAACGDGACQLGLTCSVYGVCTKPCQSDDVCGGLSANRGYPAYCNVYGECTSGCEDDSDCPGLLSCRPRADGLKLCDETYQDPDVPSVPLGDPCGDNLCDPVTSDGCVLGYCSKPCTSNEDCSAPSSLNLSSQCVPIQGTKAYCQPSCAVETDCILRTCTEVTTIDGTLAKTCVAERGAALVGDACLRDDDCADALAVCRSEMCVVPCTADEGCPSVTATGEPARCIRHWVGQVCLAGCNAASARCNPEAKCARISEGNEVCVP